MRILSLLLIVVMTQVPLARAEEVDTWFVGLNELMSLKEESRRTYLGEMRDILLEFEINTNAALPGVRDTASFGFGVLPRAFAALEDPGAQRLKCGTGEDWRRLDGTEFCVSQTSDPSNQNPTCPKGYLSVAHAGINPRVAAKNGWMCYSRFENEFTAGRKVRPPARDAALGQSRSLAPIDPAPRAPVPTYAAGGDVGNGGAAQPPRSDRSLGGVPPAPAPERPDQARNKAPEHGGKPNPPDQKKNPAKTCTPKIPRCGETRERARKEFFAHSAENRACVYAGNVSQYRNGKLVKYGCEPKSSVTLGSHEYTCKSGVACNPLVFCVPDPGGKAAFCARSGMEATDECDRKAKQGDDAKDCLTKLLGNEKLVSKETWDSFLKSLKKVCETDQASAKFHCRECRIMYHRILALNEEHYGPLCGTEGKGGAHGRPGGKGADDGKSSATR